MYYAGNTYFNLNDIPKSLMYFQRAVDVASSSKNCDSALLRNTYSRLETLSKKDSNQYRYYKDSEAEKLNSFIFASDLFRKVKEVELSEEK